MELNLVAAAITAALSVLTAVLLGVGVLLVGRWSGDPGAAKNHARSLVATVLLVGAALTLARAVDSRVVDEGLQDLGRTAVQALPAAVIAALFLSFGLLVAGAARSMTRRSLQRLQPAVAVPASQLVYVVLVVLVVLTVVGQLGLRTDLLERVLLLGMATLAVAFALSLGLALRPLLGAVVTTRHVQRILSPDDHIRIADLEGAVDRLGPSSVRLRLADGDTVEVPNDWFLSRPVHRRDPSATRSGNGS